jgi:NAD(P)-dependent dehydrogenase (short-subunit alcohol dehydrogenase family)
MSKSIFITGTSSGLGKASAKHFAQQGWKVAATMRSPEKETELTQHKNISVFKLDVTRLDQVRDATEVPVQVVKTGLTPQIGPSDRLREAEAVQLHPAGPLRTPL